MLEKRRFPYLHVFMFAITFCSMLVAGSLLKGVNPVEEPIRVVEGLPFSIALMCILLCHEFAHYFASKAHRVTATLPFFIPAPTIIGTFGAFIKMKSPILSKRALVDIGASGPIAGFIVALVAAIIGLRMSEVIQLTDAPGGIYLGSSLLFQAISYLTIGHVPEGYDVLLHPVAFAGWVGFLVTSLNLIPIGQLDGGHVTFALLGRRHRKFSLILIAILMVMGTFLWSGWLIWAFLMVMLGIDHPPILHEEIALDKKRKHIGLFCLVIFVLTFTPVPFHFDI
jgi:membrane-associated protease RseP (regulator of RpoE activity)